MLAGLTKAMTGEEVHHHHKGKVTRAETPMIVTAAVTGMEIVAVIGMVTGTVIEVDIPVPGRESKRHQRNVQDWPWHPEANPRRKRVEIQLLLQVSLVVLSLLTQCRRRRRWMRSLPERRRKRREQEKRQEKLQNPIHLVQPN